MAIKEDNERVYTPKKIKKLPNKLDLSRANRIPWTDKQLDLINKLTRKQKFTNTEQLDSDQPLKAIDTKCAFISGRAGTSKTITAVYSALKLLDEGKIETIYYVRSAVPSSPHQLGYLKGSLEEKMGVYQAPLDDKLSELLSPEHTKLLIDGGFIKVESTCYLRGRNLANCVVIIDESQNLQTEELVTIISRIAERGKIWFCYDSKQSDLSNSHKKDMDRFEEIFNPEEDFDNKRNGFVSFKFGVEDIVRSKFCKYVMGKLETYEDNKSRLKYEKRNSFETSNNQVIFDGGGGLKRNISDYIPSEQLSLPLTMIVCDTCGFKRCPHSYDDKSECSNSNDIEQ